jgi:molecular chaperone GrpE
MAKKKHGKKDAAEETGTSKLATELEDAGTEAAGSAAPRDDIGDDQGDQPADGGPGEGDAHHTGSVEEELEAVRAEAQDAADRALRILAEFDNFRRRSERQLAESRTAGAADVLRELLDVADNLDRALEHAGEDVPPAFVDGMQLVARGLHDLLDRKGVARMQAEGQPFDPERHEALTVMPTDAAPPNTIVQQVQPGYTLGERVLRPAKVIVAAAPPAADGSGS